MSQNVNFKASFAMIGLFRAQFLVFGMQHAKWPTNDTEIYIDFEHFSHLILMNYVDCHVWKMSFFAPFCWIYFTLAVSHAARKKLRCKRKAKMIGKHEIRDSVKVHKSRQPQLCNKDFFLTWFHVYVVFLYVFCFVLEYRMLLES